MSNRVGKFAGRGEFVGGPHRVFGELAIGNVRKNNRPSEEGAIEGEGIHGHGDNLLFNLKFRCISFWSFMLKWLAGPENFEEHFGSTRIPLARTSESTNGRKCLIHLRQATFVVDECQPLRSCVRSRLPLRSRRARYQFGRL